MNNDRDNEIRMIPLDHITIVNPRERGQAKFRQIVGNISRLGLKKPITVTPKESSNGSQEYFLVCGQGRYEAFVILGETEIPAIVVRVSKQRLLLMSLVENLARRQPSSLELMQEIGALRNRGNTFSDIARKTDLDVTYVRGIVKLLKNGEEKLVQAVERGKIPVSVAVTIATSDDHAVQKALAEAYEANQLRGKRLLAARRLIERRRTNGKAIRGGARRTNGEGLSSKDLLKTYEEETTRMRLVIQKSKLCETRLLFIASALKQLLNDENFHTLFRAESLDTLPAYLADQIHGQESSNGKAH